MNNEEKIINLLEEIRDKQRQNTEKAQQMQQKAFKRIFIVAFVIILFLIILKIF